MRDNKINRVQDTRIETADVGVHLVLSRYLTTIYAVIYTGTPEQHCRVVSMCCYFDIKGYLSVDQ